MTIWNGPPLPSLGAFFQMPQETFLFRTLSLEEIEMELKRQSFNDDAKKSLLFLSPKIKPGNLIVPTVTLLGVGKPPNNEKGIEIPEFGGMFFTKISNKDNPIEIPENKPCMF